MELRLGFSPCPNDTYIFEALINGKIKSKLSFTETLADVQQLNKMAFENQLDLTKISFAAYPEASSNYQILNVGSALGRNCGPLLIAKKDIDFEDFKTRTNARIAIPGQATTANLLLNIALPYHQNKLDLVFSDIEQAVIDGYVDCGLIIHESRFTYRSKGLIKVIDLGEFWESEYQLPIPLGCIAIKRSLPDEVKIEADQMIAQSLKKTNANPDLAMDYIRAHAQEMDEKVMLQHIHLYVNQFTLNLGDEGRNAIRFLFEKGQELGFLTAPQEPIFVD